MNDSYPHNPFNRQNDSSDARNSRLFATGQGERTDSFISKPYESTKSRKSNHVISSRREIRIKKSELRRNVLIAISVLIGLVMALIATDTWKVGTGPQPSFSKSLSNFSTQSSQSAQVAGKQIVNLRELSADDPLRVYIGGDSLVGSFGSQLATSLGETGVVTAAYDSRVSSGLVNSGFFDWENHIETMVSKYNPELIVFMIGTNDASFVSANPKDYESKYTKLLENFLEITQTENREVAFVLAPAMKEAALDRNTKKLNEVIKKVALDNSAYALDSGRVLSPSGKYVSSIQMRKKINVRSGDGVHISSDGGDLLSDLIENFLLSNFGIDRFSAPRPIKATKVPGCCSSPKVVPSGTISKSSATSSTLVTSTSSSTSSSSPEAPVPANESETLGE